MFNHLENLGGGGSKWPPWINLLQKIAWLSDGEIDTFSDYSGRKAPSQEFEAVLFFRRVALVWPARKIGMRFYKQNGGYNIE